MCRSCGCGLKTDHDDPANLTTADLKAAAKTKQGPGTVAGVLKNLRSKRKKTK